MGVQAKPNRVLSDAKTVLAAAKSVLAVAKIFLAAAAKTVLVARTARGRPRPSESGKLAAAKKVLAAVTPRPANFAIAWRAFVVEKDGFPETVSLIDTYAFFLVQMLSPIVNDMIRCSDPLLRPCHPFDLAVSPYWSEPRSDETGNAELLERSGCYH